MAKLDACIAKQDTAAIEASKSSRTDARRRLHALPLHQRRQDRRRAPIEFLFKIIDQALGSRRQNPASTLRRPAPPPAAAAATPACTHRQEVTPTPRSFSGLPVHRVYVSSNLTSADNNRTPCAAPPTSSLLSSPPPLSRSPPAATTRRAAALRRRTKPRRRPQILRQPSARRAATRRRHHRQRRRPLRRRRLFIPHMYRYYYGGLGGYALGSIVSGGSYAPVPGHSYSATSAAAARPVSGTSRGGFGSSFSCSGGHGGGGGE